MLPEKSAADAYPQSQESPRYGWKNCECLIYASGTLADGFKRKTTGSWEWPETERTASAWEQAGRWSAPAVVPDPESEPAPKVAAGVNVEEATKAF